MEAGLLREQRHERVRLDVEPQAEPRRLDAARMKARELRPHRASAHGLARHREREIERCIGAARHQKRARHEAEATLFHQRERRRRIDAAQQQRVGEAPGAQTGVARGARRVEAEPPSEAANPARRTGRRAGLGRALAAREGIGRRPGRRAALELAQLQPLTGPRRGRRRERCARGHVGSPQDAPGLAPLTPEAGRSRQAAPLAAREAGAHGTRGGARQQRGEALELGPAGQRRHIGLGDEPHRGRGSEPAVTHQPDQIACAKRGRQWERQHAQLLEVDQPELVAS